MDDLIKKDRQQNKGGKNKLIKKKALKNGPKALRNKVGNQRKVNNAFGKGNQDNNKQNNKNRNIRRIQKARENTNNHKKVQLQQNKREEGKNQQKNALQAQKRPQ